MEELEARLRANIRRSAVREAGNATGQIQIRELHFDLAKRRVNLAGQSIHLTPKDCDLLCLPATHPGQVVTHPILAQTLRSEAHKRPGQLVRVYINALRAKLHESGNEPNINTKTGIGYRFTDH